MSSSSGPGDANNHLAYPSTSSAQQPETTARNENVREQSTSRVPQPQHVINGRDAVASASYNLAVNDEPQVTEHSLENLLTFTDIGEQQQLILDAQTNAPAASYVRSPAQLPIDDGTSILCNLDYPQVATSQLSTDLENIPKVHLMRLPPTGAPSQSRSCPDCNVVCGDLDHLQRHAEIHEYRFACLVCDKRFSRDALLTAHIGWAHPPDAATGQRDEDNGLFPCGECDVVCADSEARERHAQEHSYRLTCSSCNKRFALSEDLAAHACTSGVNAVRQRAWIYTKRFPCTMHGCGARFVLKEQFDQHMRVHERLRQRREGVLCGICDFKCRDEEDLNRHHTADHTQKLVCQFCDRRFASDADLTAHVFIEHPTAETRLLDPPPVVGGSGDATTRRTPEAGQVGGGAALVCRWPGCGKTFSHLVNLTRHMKSHSSEKEFVCRFCGMKFMRRDTRTKHARRKHKKDGYEDESDEDWF